MLQGKIERIGARVANSVTSLGVSAQVLQRHQIGHVARTKINADPCPGSGMLPFPENSAQTTGTWRIGCIAAPSPLPPLNVAVFIIVVLLTYKRDMSMQNFRICEAVIVRLKLVGD